jgi:hypothetical protein
MKAYDVVAFVGAWLVAWASLSFITAHYVLQWLVR